jgi:hypothetical protein
MVVIAYQNRIVLLPERPSKKRAARSKASIRGLNGKKTAHECGRFIGLAEYFSDSEQADFFAPVIRIGVAAQPVICV